MLLNGEQVTKKWLAAKLEHVIWDNDEKIITDEVNRGIQYGFRTIYSPNHHWHSLVRGLLDGTNILMSTPLNFYHGMMSPAAIAAESAVAQKGGCTAMDLIPDRNALAIGDWKGLAESVRAARDNFAGEIKVLTNCNGTLDDMYRMVDAIKEGGASHVKAYDQNTVGCPMDRILLLKKKCDEVGLELKASGNGKYWTTAICMGAFAAGAQCVSASNTFQIVDDLPVFEALYSRYQY